MQKISLVYGTNTTLKENSTLTTIFAQSPLQIQWEGKATPFHAPNGRDVFLIGNVVGIKSVKGKMQRATPENVKKFISSNSLTNAREMLEGRFLLISVSKDGACEIVADQFGQADLYYQENAGNVTIVNSLDLLDPEKIDGYDQASLAHVLNVYGYRPPKEHTIYAGVRRLGIGESIQITKKGFKLLKTPFHAKAGPVYDESKLNEYAELFLDALRVRSSDKGNVVYLSSGWDSSAILAGLVHLHGPKKVRAVTGRMNYNKRTGIINQFELDRAREIADFFGVRLDIAELDYWKRGPEYLDQAREVFKSQQMTSITALNHMRLAETVAKSYKKDESVFVGEISDGAHNLGFSQFVTIFHSDLGFREYSDKMNSYLFGPSFLQLIEKNKHANDLIYTLLANRTNALFDELNTTKAGAIKRQLMESFFLRNTRIPLFSRKNSKLLTAQGQDRHNETMTAYFDDFVREGDASTLYAWYLHLYNSFHWQGSTVSCIFLAGNHYGFDVQMPFWDSRLIEFLSGMPETWGRGLDLNPTKYPLKWTLKNKLKYPFHLQVGPHSYLYDVDPNFSHSAEILYGSSFTPYLKELLKTRSYRDILDPEVFDMKYIDSIVSNYLKGNEVVGIERNDLFSICMLEWTGDYIRKAPAPAPDRREEGALV